jgi:hypothetical protein
MTYDANPPHRLNPWNPLDHLRLLWWVLVTPQRLLAYREVYRENDERRVNKWLTHTLICLPIFVVTLALGVGILPSTERHFSSVYLWVSLVLAWALLGWLQREFTVLAVGFLFIVASFVAERMAVGTTGILAFFAVSAVTFVVTGVVAVSVASNTAIHVIGVKLSVAIIAAGFAILGVAMARGSEVAVSIVAGVITFMATLVVMGGMADIIKGSLSNGRPSWLARGAFGALMLVYVFVTWFSFLGGWRVFR